MMRLILATAAGLIWAGGAFAQSGCGGPVSFPKGKDRVTVGGRITGTSTCDFTLHGQTGQRLGAAVNSQGPVSARVIAPVAQRLSADPWVMPQTGDYTIRLEQAAEPAAAGQAAQFTVEFRLSGAGDTPPTPTPATAGSARPAAKPAARTTASAIPPERPAAAATATRPAARPAQRAATPAPAAATPPTPAPAAATPPAATPTTAAAPQSTGETRCDPARTVENAISVSGRIAGSGSCEYSLTARPGQKLTLVMPRAEGFRVQLISPAQAALTPDQPLALSQEGAQTVRITRESGAGEFVARLRLD